MPRIPKEVEIPAHVQAVVNFTFGPHRIYFKAEKGFDGPNPAIRFRLHDPRRVGDFRNWAMPLAAHREIVVREIRQSRLTARHHVMIRLPKGAAKALSAAWRAKQAEIEA